MDRVSNIENAAALYDGKIHLVDGFMGLLADRLENLGLDDRTLLIITSDHGEGFLEHGLGNHGNSLYDELVRVPLLHSRSCLYNLS